MLIMFEIQILNPSKFICLLPMPNETDFRPRYKFHTDYGIEEIENRVKLHAIAVPGEVVLKHVHGHIVFSIPESKRHFYSPQMDMAMEIDPDNNKVQVRCLIGPIPNVWTMFMFFYGFLVLQVLWD